MKKVVIFLHIVLSTSATDVETKFGAEVKTWLLSNEETLLLNHHRAHSAIFWNLNRIIKSDERAKL